MDSDNPPAEEPNEWVLQDWDHEDDNDEGQLDPPVWRRPLIIGVALLTAVAMALVPLYNLVGGGGRAVADNGLEVCGFDYCVVQAEIRSIGLDLAMSRFSNIYSMMRVQHGSPTSLLAISTFSRCQLLSSIVLRAEWEDCTTRQHERFTSRDRQGHGPFSMRCRMLLPPVTVTTSWPPLWI